MESQGTKKAITAVALFTALLVTRDTLSDDPTGAEILARSVRVTGCAVQWKTRIEEGTFIAWNTPGWGTLRASYQRIVKKPDKAKIDQDYSAYDHPFFRTFYYNSGDAWAVTNLVPRRSKRTKQMLEDFLERVDWLKYYEESSDTVLSGGTIDGDSLFKGKKIIRLYCLSGGDSTIIDVDAATFLPLRETSPAAVTKIFEDYRRVQGRCIPFRTVVFEKGKKTQEIIWDHVEFDTQIDDSVFVEEKPRD